MTIAELSVRISKSGELVIPADAIAEMALKPGDCVRIAYVSKDGKANDYRELLLSATGIEGMEDEDSSFPIPIQLLEQANISENSDLQIACFDGLIVICKTESLELGELSEILLRLNKAREFADYYSYGESLSFIRDQLADIIQYYDEGGESSE